MHRTWGDIKKEVCCLGFEEMTAAEDGEYKEIFIRAANEAQDTIARTVRPIIRQHHITLCPASNLVDGRERSYDGSDIVYTASAVCAYYFEVYGTGRCELTDADGVTQLDFSADNGWKRYKGFCKGNVTLRFYSTFVFIVRNVALYDRIVGPNIADIPDNSAYTRYDLKLLIPQYASIDSSGVKICGNGFPKDFSDWELENDRFLLLPNRSAEYVVYYQAYPQRITEETPDDFEIELDLDAADLMPRRMAYTIWLDDDVQKAVIYNNEYVSMVQALLAKTAQPTARVVKGRDI